MTLPGSLAEDHNCEQEHFLRRLARYRENNSEEETVVNYFDELDIPPLYLGDPWSPATYLIKLLWHLIQAWHTLWNVKKLICQRFTNSWCSSLKTKPYHFPRLPLILSEITSSNQPDGLLLMQKIVDTVGQPRNFGPSDQEVEEEERRKAAERLKREAQEKAEEERREAEEARHRNACWEEWVGGDERWWWSFRSQRNPLTAVLSSSSISVMSKSDDTHRLKPQLSWNTGPHLKKRHFRGKSDYLSLSDLDWFFMLSI